MNKPTLPGLVPDGADVQVVHVTPEMAAKWLAVNDHNRTISEVVVNQYAADMEAGRWKFTGDPIQFSETGHLSNGQHRLTAQVKSGTTQTYVVITGLSRESQDYMDIGRVRSVANQMQLKGVHNAWAIAAVARMIMVYEGARNPSKPAVRAYAEQNVAEFHPAAVLGRSIAQVIRGSSSAYGAAAVTLNRIDPERAHDFFEALQYGANLPEGSPVLVLRAWIMKTQAKVNNTDEHRVAFINGIFHTWNLWLAGRKTRSFSLPRGTVTPAALDAKLSVVKASA